MIEIIAKALTAVIIPSSCLFFAISVDETTDISKIEQVAIVLRYVDEKLHIHEKFVGFFDTSNTTARALCDLILTVLERN